MLQRQPHDVPEAKLARMPGPGLEFSRISDKMPN